MIRLLIMNASTNASAGDADLRKLINSDYLNFEFNYLDDTYFLIPGSLSKDELEISLIKNGNEISKVSVYFIEKDENGNNLYDVYIDDKVQESVDFGMVDTLVSNWLNGFFREIEFSEEDEIQSLEQGAYIGSTAAIIDKIAFYVMKDEVSEEEHRERLEYYIDKLSSEQSVVSYCKKFVLETLNRWRNVDENHRYKKKFYRKFLPDRIIIDIANYDSEQVVKTLEFPIDKVRIHRIIFDRDYTFDFEKGCIFITLMKKEPGSDKCRSGFMFNFIDVKRGSRWTALFRVEDIEAKKC